MRAERILWAGFVLAIIAYLLPWVVNNASGLTMGAYDFAEFLSKISMTDMRVYNTVLLLRGQLLLLTCFLAFGANRPFFTADWWFRTIIGILLIVAQLPALNMIMSIGSDINRQQQVLLAVLAFFALTLGLTGRISRWQGWLWPFLGILTIGTSLYGILNGIDIMKLYHLNPSWGLAGIGYLLLSIAFAVMSARSLWAKNR